MDKTITAIILAHFKEREGNLKCIVDDLLVGTVIPLNIIVFVDNPEIEFEYDDNRVVIIRSTKSFLPKIRFALGTYFDTDYCFFIDDDLTVRKKTLENFLKHADKWSILGLEGSVLGDTPTPYANDTCINRGNKFLTVDIVIRTYFVPVRSLEAGLWLQQLHKSQPREFLDDVYLCLGNKYINKKNNYVIPVDKESDLTELYDGGVGQSRQGEHYENRNKVIRFLMDRYES